jgi:dTDP-4-dehydrorhamnose reductase
MKCLTQTDKIVLHFSTQLVFTGKFSQYEEFKNQSACPNCFKSLYMYIHTLSEYYILSYILYITNMYTSSYQIKVNRTRIVLLTTYSF